MGFTADDAHMIVSAQFPQRAQLTQEGSDMQLFNSMKHYGAIPQALHWLTVFLVALAWALGIFGHRNVAEARPGDGALADRGV